jgi:hypothetical protein
LLIRLLSCFALLVVVTSCTTKPLRVGGPATFYISREGNDSHPGTLTQPWRTIGQANEFLEAGDTVYVWGGTYTEGIEPLHAGRPGSPIAYCSFPGEQVLIASRWGARFTAEDSNVVVDGFTIHASVGCVQINGSTRITIRNCTMRSQGKGMTAWTAVALDYGASYCRIEHNSLDREDVPVAGPDSGPEYRGDGIGLNGRDGYQLHHNVIEGNRVTGCQHVGITGSYGFQHHNVWRSNVAYKNHTNYSFEDGGNWILVDGNTGYYPGLVWLDGNGRSFQFSGHKDAIVRYNVMYSDTANPNPLHRQWLDIWNSATTAWTGDGGADLLRNKIYNNTVYGESDETRFTQFVLVTTNDGSTGRRMQGNVYKNNIFARGTRTIQVEEEDVTKPLADFDTYYDGNVLWSGIRGEATIGYISREGSAAFTVAEAIQRLPRVWSSTNREGDPLFADVIAQGPAKNFHPGPGSPCIDAGVPLTEATGNGHKSTRLTVTDAGYFSDGWGIVESDSITVEGTRPVGITAIEYATHTITLDAPRTWNTGAHVWYYRSDRVAGSSPDIGAFEFGRD